MTTQRRTAAALAVMALALLTAVASPSTSGRLTARIDNSTNTAASAVFSSTQSCAQALGGIPLYFVHPLTEGAGSTSAADISGNNRNATYTNTGGIQYSINGPRPCPRDNGRGITLDGSSGFLHAASASPGPQVFTVQLWFRTTTTNGGKLAGFGNATGTDASGNYDRHVYMTNAGRLVFGVHPGAARTISTTASYNDGAWHQVVATLSAQDGETRGMRLYVDGRLQIHNPDVTSAEGFNGSWRFGFDSLSGWPETPRSRYFAGSIAWPAVSTAAITPSQVQALYDAGRP